LLAGCEKLVKLNATREAEKNIRSIFQPMFMRVRSDSGTAARRWRLQVVAWFVTTVKRDTALEALARRRSRLDVSENMVVLGFQPASVSLQRTVSIDSNL